MIGMRRLDHLRGAPVTDVLAAGTPGDLIETGVWRGGATIFMRGVLKAHAVTDRTVWVADAFAAGSRRPSDEGRRRGRSPRRGSRSSAALCSAGSSR